MQLINNFEEILIMAKSPGGELFSAFGTSKDTPKVTEVSQCHLLVCLGGQKRSCGGVFATFVCKPILKQYIIGLLQYIHRGIFKRLV